MTDFNVVQGEGSDFTVELIPETLTAADRSAEAHIAAHRQHLKEISGEAPDDGVVAPGEVY